MLRIGVDVGGTHTDAVLMDDTRLLAAHKALTSADIGQGVALAMADVLRQAGVPASALKAVMIGTTQFTNAVIEGRRLGSVGVLRICLPAARDVHPMMDWPPALLGAFKSAIAQVRGGVDFNGHAYADLDEHAVREALLEFARAGVKAIAVSQVFAPVRAEAEERVAELAAELLPGTPVTCSHTIGRMGLLERENAAILNAALVPLADQVISAFAASLHALGIKAPLYISQNDGTLMDAGRARQYPVLTFASGPTNSMRGAAYLTGLKDAIVVDVGGTTADIGVLRGGFPRESSTSAVIAGVRTNFRMPDVLSIGLGGGSQVRFTDHSDQNRGISIGPQSVGHELHRRARIFGGDTLTVTDIAVAAGRLELGDKTALAEYSPMQIDAAMAAIGTKLEDAIERMRTSAEAIPVILVGGGAVLPPEIDNHGGRVIRPENAGVANAIGAAITQISGEVDRTIAMAERKREDVLAQFKHEATEIAVKAGALRDTVQLIDLDETQLAYLPGSNMRIRVRVAGELRL